MTYSEVWEKIVATSRRRPARRTRKARKRRLEQGYSISEAKMYRFKSLGEIRREYHNTIIRETNTSIHLLIKKSHTTAFMSKKWILTLQGKLLTSKFSNEVNNNRKTSVLHVSSFENQPETGSKLRRMVLRNRIIVKKWMIRRV